MKQVVSSKATRCIALISVGKLLVRWLSICCDHADAAQALALKGSTAGKGVSYVTQQVTLLPKAVLRVDESDAHW